MLLPQILPHLLFGLLFYCTLVLNQFFSPLLNLIPLHNPLLLYLYWNLHLYLHFHVSAETSSQHAYSFSTSHFCTRYFPTRTFSYYILIWHIHTSYGNLITIPHNLPHIKLQPNSHTGLHLWMKNMMPLWHGLSNYLLSFIHFSKYSHKYFPNFLNMGDW